MNQIKVSRDWARLPRAAIALLLLLVLAFALNLTALLQVFSEYGMLTEWEARQGAVALSEIHALRRDVGARIVVRAVASALLLLCTLALLWLEQRQLGVLRMLNQVKILAFDILSSMDQGVVTTDLNDTVTGVNASALRLLGMESDSVGAPLAGLATAGLALAALTRRVAASQSAVWDETFALECDGRVRRIRADAHVLKGASGEPLGCVILLRDVSDRLLMEERVRWIERFHALFLLASGLHHEIKNPLTALSIHVQLLEKRLNAPTPRPVGELIGVLKSEMLRLNGVLDNFRDFASLRRLAVLPVDVPELLEETGRLIRPQASRQHVEVSVMRPQAPLPLVPLDADKFKQAVLNLVINALEAMPAGGALRLSASARLGELVVEVEDDGPGIAPEVQPDLFKPYVSTKARGSGMGLALAEKVISQHGGRVEFQTGPAGTTFRITIPIGPAAPAGPPP